MTDQNMTVNVSDIVASVKEEIALKFKPEDIMDFEDVDPLEVLRSVDPGLAFNHQYFCDIHNGAAEKQHMVYYHHILGSAPAVFVKKVFRKLGRGVIEPLVDQQNDYNSRMVIATKQLYLRCNDQQAEIDELKKQLSALQIRLSQLELDKSQEVGQ